MKIIRNVFMFMMLSLLTTSSYAQSAIDLMGNYYCTGYDPYINGNYTTRISIKKVGHSYAVIWDMGNGDLYAGAGMLNYDATTFSVLFYKDKKNVSNAGLAVYRITVNHLKGQWVMSETANKIGFEDCVKRV